MMMYGDWGSGWMGFGGWLLMFLVWGLAIFGLVALVRWSMSSSDRPGESGEPSALEILQRRYASGEIDQETFQRMKAELETQP